MAQSGPLPSSDIFPTTLLNLLSSKTYCKVYQLCLFSSLPLTKYFHYGKRPLNQHACASRYISELFFNPLLLYLFCLLLPHFPPSSLLPHSFTVPFFLSLSSISFFSIFSYFYKRPTYKINSTKNYQISILCNNIVQIDSISSVMSWNLFQVNSKY